MKTLLTLLCFWAAPAAAAVRQEISAVIEPADGTLNAVVTVRAGKPRSSFVFTLHKGLSPAARSGTLTLENPAAAAGPGITSPQSDEALETYRVTLPRPARELRLTYSGRIAHELQGQAQEYARSFSETRGIISEQGCYLSGASGWYPRFEGEAVSFRLQTNLPAPYASVAGGTRLKTGTAGGRTITVWEEAAPLDEITLTCGRYAEYSRPGRPALYAFLQEKDDELAARYLDAAEKYTALYSGLLGPYPYAKFALVENFWETGYGMPSFTLLGPKVLRLPFILNSSYPHEILHNWWGNGVFVDYPSGNWCEGLTAYLADYLVAEARGKDRDYRASALQKYAAYVRQDKDFPLTDFRTRHSSASEAVGYGKALMFYHMLRSSLGDASFRAGLRAFYAGNRGRTASFADLRAAFEQVTGAGRLAGFFAQWVERAGAPELALKDVRLTRGPNGYSAEFVLRQEQPGEPYALKVPLVAHLEGVSEPRRQFLEFNAREERFSYSVPLRILRLEIDPDFDLFRRLSPLETPPALTSLLGAKEPALLLSGGSARQAWLDFAAAWNKDPENQPRLQSAGAIPASPFWLLGGGTPEARAFESRLQAYGARFTPETVTLDGREFSRAGHTFVFADYHQADPALAGGLIETPAPDKLGLLAAKLPHYGKYSWLVFDASMNSLATGVWPARRSPLTADFSAGEYKGAATARRQPLAALPSDFSSVRMKADAAALASSAGRAPGTAGHKAAAAYIIDGFRKAGLKPFQPGPPAGAPARGWNQPAASVNIPGTANILGLAPGTDKPREYLVLAAHYDHLPATDGKVYPGADDNASGAAVLLELARYYAAHPRERSIIFAAFDGEERGRLGSKKFLKDFGDAPGSINAALNFDTVGRLGAGKLLLLNSASSDKWVYILRGAGFVTGTDYAAVKEDLDASDQASFIEKGVPALQFFSGPNADYHKPSDTADKLDAAGMVKTAEFAKELIDFLAGPAPFITRPPGTPGAAAAPAGPRKVSTGLVPDFSYAGEGEAAGVRAQDITPGSPLDKAGVKAGEVILELNGRRVGGLRDYSEILKTLELGAKVPVTVLTPESAGKPGATRSVQVETAPAL